MAQLTWKNVDAPNFSSVNDLIRTAAHSLQSGFKAGRDAIDDFQKDATDTESARLQAAVLRGEDPTVALKAANPEFLSNEALMFAAQQPQRVAQLGMTQANIAQQQIANEQAVKMNPHLLDQAVELNRHNAVQNPLNEAKTRLINEGTGFDNAIKSLNVDEQKLALDHRAKTKELYSQVLGAGTYEGGAEILSKNMGNYDPVVTKQVKSLMDANRDVAWGKPNPLQYDSAALAQSAAPGLMGLLTKHEGGGDYKTLFGHAQRPGGAYAGVDVTRMSIDELDKFSEGYGQHVRRRLAGMGQNPRIATPMGFYQIVNSTLQDAAKELGLPGNTIFNKETQDKIGIHLANKRIKGASTMEGKVAGLRAEWEGFKNVPTNQLVAAIKEFENGNTGALIGTAEGQRLTASATGANGGVGSVPNLPRSLDTANTDTDDPIQLFRAADTVSKIGKESSLINDTDEAANPIAGLTSALIKAKDNTDTLADVEQRLTKKLADKETNKEFMELNNVTPTKISRVLSDLTSKGISPAMAGAIIESSITATDNNGILPIGWAFDADDRRFINTDTVKETLGRFFDADGKLNKNTLQKGQDLVRVKEAKDAVRATIKDRQNRLEAAQLALSSSQETQRNRPGVSTSREMDRLRKEIEAYKAYLARLSPNTLKANEKMNSQRNAR